MTSPQSSLLGYAQASALLGVSESTVRKYVQAGRLTVVQRHAVPGQPGKPRCLLEAGAVQKLLGRDPVSERRRAVVLARQRHVLATLASAGQQTGRQLAERGGVSPRTTTSDIRALARACAQGRVKAVASLRLVWRQHGGYRLEIRQIERLQAFGREIPLRGEQQP